MSKVDFNLENIEKCLCKTCPVQAESTCAQEKIRKIQDMIPELMESKQLPEKKMVPGVYCAHGKALCDDLDFKQMCQCNECPLWDEYDLIDGEPMGYYCRDGEAK